MVRDREGVPADLDLVSLSVVGLPPDAPEMGRLGTCRGCGRRFRFPHTGPPRVYCNAACRGEAHAARGLHELDGETLDPRVPPTPLEPARSDFSVRFRDADPIARDFEVVLAGDPCSYCGRSGGDMEADHIEPFIVGGRGTWDNLTASCKHCNSSKCDASMLWWLLHSPRLVGLYWQRRQDALFGGLDL